MNQDKIKKDFKIYLIIYPILVFTVVAGVIYIYRMTRLQAPEPGALELIAENEAKNFGENHNTMDCVNESLQRLKTCDIDDIKSRIANKLFLQKCLLRTKKSTEICDEIVMQQKNQNLNTVRWVAHTCANHKEIHNVVCVNTLEAVEDYCRVKAP